MTTPHRLAATVLGLALLASPAARAEEAAQAAPPPDQPTTDGPPSAAAPAPPAATPPAATPPAPPPPRARPASDGEAPVQAFGSTASASESYRGVLIISDAVSLGIAGLGRLAASDSVMASGLALNICDGFIVHPFAYPPGHKGTGFGKGVLSLVLRGGLSFGLCAAGSGCFGQEMGNAALLRMMGGLVLADAIDIIFLAQRPQAPDRQAGLRMSPVAYAAAQGGHVGMVARW